MGMRRDFLKRGKGGRFGIRAAPVRKHYYTYSGRSATRGQLRHASVHVHRDTGAHQSASGQRQHGGRHIDRRPVRGRVAPNDRLLRREEVEARCGIARSTIYRLMRESRFPQPLRIGERAVRWSEAEIVGWLASLPRATGYIP